MLLFPLYLLFLSFLPSFPYSLSGNTLRDLESNMVDLFQADANAWTSTTLVSPTSKIYFCFDYYLLGGYRILQPFGSFSRYYSGLPTHNMIRFTAMIRKIDSWDAVHGDTFNPFPAAHPISDTETVKFQFDSLPELSGWTSYPFAYQFHMCGNSGSTALMDTPLIAVVMEIPHTASDITVLVTSYLNQPSTDESFGFRDITMTFYTLVTPPTAQTFCGISPNPLPDRWCSCPSSDYFMNPTNSGTCYPCHYTCATCSGSTQNNCLTCFPGYYLSAGQCLPCDSSCETCSAAGLYSCLSCPEEKYLTELNNCVGSCPPPLINNASNFTEYCYSPCNSSAFLYPNGSCFSTCTFPMTPQTVANYFLLCIFPCEPHEYAFYNGTCGTSCPAPLTKITNFTRLFCNYGCASNQVLYWDGGCASSCLSQAISYTEGTVPWVRNFCAYPCLATEYLYWNKSCLATCPYSLTSVVSRGYNFCNYGCSSSQYLYWDGSCSSTCATSTKPLIQRTEGSPARRFCYFPCEIDEFLYWNGTCSKACIPPLTSSYSNSRSYCNYPCTTLQFLNWDGTCVSSCNLPYAQRIEAGLKYCDYPCALPTPYLYWNGSCLASCSSPLKITLQGPASFCNFPCSTPTDFLYFNGTCASYCSAPLTSRTEGTPIRKFCDYPCDSSDYLYWNSTCSSQCPLPLIFTAIAGKKYCDYPCVAASGAGTTSASQYLYWNSSCLSTCDSPLQVKADGSVTYCLYPCSSPTEEYLYWDGTCSKTCLSPLNSHTEITTSYPYTVKYCIAGCSSSQYLYWDGTCSSKCESPLRKVTYKGQLFCYQPCENTAYYYYFNAKICKPTCPGPYYANYTATPYLSCHQVDVSEDSWFSRNFLTSPDVQGEITLIRIVKLMEHMRYLDIKMPPRLDRLIMSKGRNILSFNFGWEMSEEMQSYFIDNELPEVFEKHGLTSSFLVNFWKDFTMLSVILCLVIIFIVLENIAKILELTLLQCFFQRLRALFKWNVAIVFLAMCMDDIVLYSSFQFRSLQSPDDPSQDYIYITFSLLSTLAAIFFSLGLLIAGFVFIHVTRAKTEDIEAKSSLFNNADFLKKCQDFQVLFQGYNPSSLWTHSFYLIYIIRACYLPMLVASYLYEYPFAQTIVQVGISLGILGFILFMKPLESRVNNVQLIISEGLVLIMNACLLALKCLEIGGVSEKSWTAILLGDFIIGGNVLFNTTWVIFLWIKLLNEAREIYKHIKSQQIKERAIWVELLVIWVQQGGIGFEEIRIRQTLDTENTWVDDSEENQTVTKDDLLRENEEEINKEEEPKEIQESDKGVSLRMLKLRTFRNYLMRNAEGIRLDESETNSRNEVGLDRLETRVNLGRSDNQLPG